MKKFLISQNSKQINLVPLNSSVSQMVAEEKKACLYNKHLSIKSTKSIHIKIKF